MTDEPVTRREALILLRTQLTAAMREEGGKDLAPISRELRAVLAEIEALPNGKAAAPADQIAAKRKERREKAAGA